MSKQNSLIVKARGLNTQPNELDVPEGSLRVAENVEITRDNVVQLSPGFADYSSNLPDFEPQQLFAYGGTLYAHHDDGIWYHDGSNWLRKRGSFGAKSTNPYGSVVVSGHLYFVGNFCVFDINLSAGTLSVLAGRFGVPGSTNGTGAAARFDAMAHMASDGTSLYVCDYGNDVIRKIVISSGVVTTLAGTAGVTGSADGTGAAAMFLQPIGIVHASGSLYVCDASNNTIRKIVISSGVVTTLAGTAGAPGTTDGTGAAARFEFPQGIAEASGDLYVSDSVNNTIRKIVISSAVVTTFAGTAGASGSTNGTGAAARFLNPDGVVVLGANMYVNDGNNTIRKIVISSAVVTTLAGTAGSTGNTDGIGSAARFDGSTSIAQDSVNLYVCDYNNDTIRKIYLSSSYVTTISGAPSVSASAPPSGYADGIIVGPS